MPIPLHAWQADITTLALDPADLAARIAVQAVRRSTAAPGAFDEISLCCVATRDLAIDQALPGPTP